jgi:hypothetical protein
MAVPNTTGVAIHDAGTVSPNGDGQITHVIDDVRGAVNKKMGAS